MEKGHIQQLTVLCQFYSRNVWLYNIRELFTSIQVTSIYLQSCVITLVGHFLNPDPDTNPNKWPTSVFTQDCK